LCRGFLCGLSINKCLFYSRKHVDSNTGEFYRNNLFEEHQMQKLYCFGSNLKGKKTIADVFSKKRYFMPQQ
jgi:hypothetical protein